MTLPRSPLLIASLRDPRSVRGMSMSSWDLLVRQARGADLLARLAARLEGGALLGDVPEAPCAHLRSASILAAAQQDEVRREVACIERALRPLDIPVVLLKGAAYLFAGLPAALGRTFADVDILVPKARLAEVEAALMLAGWATTHHDEYDQRYYREWMHELPPMQQVQRQTILDVHHAILPEIARVKTDAAKLLAAARPLPGGSRLHVLAPADMVLHSMAHVFQNEETGHGLRDLSDIDLLLRHFADSSGFWDSLVARAQELGLARPLWYGLHHVERLWATPVPRSALATARTAAPGWPVRRLMSALWSRALRAPLGPVRGVADAAAVFALYVRAHWLRMPTLRLLQHLAFKATVRRG